MITVGQLTQWILEHRKGKAFNYEAELIQRELCQSIADNAFAYQEVEGEIQGVVCAGRDDRRRVLHIYDVLTTKKGVIQNFMARFLLVYPDYKIEARRRGRLVKYNTPRLAQKLQ